MPRWTCTAASAREFPEVIYGAGKTKEHILGIARTMLKNGQGTVLVTRICKEAADYVAAELPLEYNESARVGIIGRMPEKSGKGYIVVATGRYQRYPRGRGGGPDRRSPRQ